MLQFKPVNKVSKSDMESIRLDHIAFIESIRGANGKDGADGINGKDGERGRQGLQGKQGTTGRDGVRGPAGPQGEKGDKGDSIKGDKGDKGKDGRGIDRMYIRRGDLYIIYTDGEEVNLGRVEGQQGIQGPRGFSGGVSTTSGSSSLPEDSILYLASIAPSTATYTGDKITLLTYDDFQDITSHTKTLAYTGDDLTQTVEGFVYDSKTWTVTIDLTYLSGVWQTKSINIVKV